MCHGWQTPNRVPSAFLHRKVYVGWSKIWYCSTCPLISSMDAVDDSPTGTFPTTQLTRTHNTAPVDPFVLAASNGPKYGMTRKLGGTSAGSESSATSLKTFEWNDDYTFYCVLWDGFGSFSEFVVRKFFARCRQPLQWALCVTCTSRSQV